MDPSGMLAAGIVMLLGCLLDKCICCPHPCACYLPTEVHCTFRSLSTVPAGISRQVERMNLGFNTIIGISESSFADLKKLELLMIHGNDIHQIPDNTFKDLVSLQVLKMSYNKVRVITGATFGGLSSLLRLYLDHNHIEFLQPDAFHGMSSLRVLNLEANHLQQLHPSTFSTFSLMPLFPISTIQHLYLSDNRLRNLPKDMLRGFSQLKSLYLSGNPWSCDCRMGELLAWIKTHPGVVKCKKDKENLKGPPCLTCASPRHLSKRALLDLEELVCTAPVINATNMENIPENNLSELLSSKDFKRPFGKMVFNLSDEHGNKADLSCQIVAPRDSTKVGFEQSGSEHIVANLTLIMDLVCPIQQTDYERLWKLIAYYSEVPVYLQREIMISKEPHLSYRYRQDSESDTYYYTGVRAKIISQPSWLMQPFMNLQLNRAHSTTKQVQLIIGTHFSSNLEMEMIRRQRREWVLIEQNKTQTTMTAIVGGMAEIDCSVLSAGKPSIIWTLPNMSRVEVPYTSTDSRITAGRSGKLLIKSLTHSDDGVYYCTAEFANDLDYIPIRLVVMEPSSRSPGDKMGPSVTRSVGEPFSLPCPTSAAPDAHISWIFPDGSKATIETNSSKAYVFLNGTLFVPHSHLSNNGYYKCVAVNQHGKDSLVSKVTVTQRERLQPFRRYPMRPQSAAGVSTRIKAFIDDTESSGDDGTFGRTLINPKGVPRNRLRIPQAILPGQPPRLPQRRLHGPRKTILKGHRGHNRRPDTNRNSGTLKPKIDPKKWADILAKIRQKTAPKPTVPSFAEPSATVREMKNVDLSKAKKPNLQESEEGSTSDDSALPEVGLYVLNTPPLPPQRHQHQIVPSPAYSKDQTNDIYQVVTSKPSAGLEEQTSIVITTSKLNVVANTVATTVKSRVFATQTGRITHSQYFTDILTLAQTNTSAIIGNIIPLQTAGGELDENIGSKPNENSLTSLFTTSSPTAKSRSIAVAKQGAPFNSVPSRSNKPWDSRRRFGNRRRMNRLRPRPPILRKTTTKPQEFPTSTTFASLATPEAPKQTEAYTEVSNGLPTTVSVPPTAQNDLLTGREQKQGDHETVESEGHLQNLTSTRVPLTVQGKSQGHVNSATSKTTITLKPEHKPNSVTAGNWELLQLIEYESNFNGNLQSEFPHVKNDSDQKKDNRTHLGESFRDILTTVEPSPISKSEFQALPNLEPKSAPSLPALQVTVTPHVYNLPIPTAEPDFRGEKSGKNTHLKPDKVEYAVITSTSMAETPTSFQTTPTFSSTTVPLATATLRKNPASSSTIYTSRSEHHANILHDKILQSPRRGGNDIPDDFNGGKFDPYNRQSFHTSNRDNFIFPKLDNSAVQSTTTSERDHGKENSQNSAPTKASRTPSPMGKMSTTIPSIASNASFLSILQDYNHTSQSVVNQQVSTDVSSKTLDGPYHLPGTVPGLNKKPRITTSNIYTIMVNASTDVKLPCEAVAEPKPFITWTKVSTGATMSSNSKHQRFEVLANGTFLIHNVQLQDRGQYLCTVENLFGVDKLIVTLIVLAQQPKVLTPQHRDVTVYVSQSASLDCQAKGMPEPHITWVLPNRVVLHAASLTDQRIMLLPNGTLQIRQAHNSDQGIYKCIASNVAGADTTSVRMYVAALPPIIQQPLSENVSFSEGQTAYIHCTGKGTPQPAIQWILSDGMQVRPSQFVKGHLFVFPNGTLYIRSLSMRDNGGYECMASNAVGKAKRTVALVVKKNTSMAKITSTSPQSTEVMYGETLRLDCVAKGDPAPRIVWRTPSKKLTDANYSFDRRMKVFTNGTLSIQGVTDQDEGDYLCVARNKMGDDYVLLKANVMMKAARIEGKQSSSHRVSHGGHLKVDCIASGLPSPEIRWSLPDGSMINSAVPSDDSSIRTRRYVVFDNGTLYFNEVGMKEEGDYICYAENRLGKDEMKVHIKVVADQPIIQNKTHGVIKASYGDTVTLACSVKGEPPPTIAWLSPTSRIIPPSSDKYQLHSDGTLFIQKVQKFDSGSYTCTAKNMAGVDRKVVMLEVLVSAPTINGLSNSFNHVVETAVRHQRKLLNCKAEGNPIPRVMWVLPDNVVLLAPHYGSKTTVHRNGTLDIHSLQKADSVELLCIARNEGGEARQQVTLNVIEEVEKPKLKDAVTEKLFPNVGDSITLNCSVEGKPTPKVTWILPNSTTITAVTSVFRFHLRSDGALLIRNVSMFDIGRYRCIARNSAGFVERTVILESEKKPKIYNEYNAVVSIINGENLQLNCLSKGTPYPKLTWTLPSGKVLTRAETTGRYKVLENGTLLVQQATVYDRGTYQCKLTNSHGMSVLSVPVIVIAYPPRITNGPAAVTYARPGAAVQLNCMVIGIPKAEVVWEMPDKTSLKAGTQARVYGNKYLHPQGSLVIQKPSNRDNGFYRCTAKNVVGSDTKSTYLHVY